jgi:hypothetical protein
MRRVGLFLVLAACGAPLQESPARVEQVILYRETVTVQMSDGTLCVSDRPGRAPYWTGTLQGCPHALPVRVNALPDRPRAVLSRGGGQVVVAGEGWG